MSNSKKQRKLSSQDLPILTPYHWKKNKDAGKEVEEMLKHPYSLEEVKAQTARKYAMKEKNKKGF